jgi:hypothetical protein
MRFGGPARQSWFWDAFLAFGAQDVVREPPHLRLSAVERTGLSEEEILDV